VATQHYQYSIRRVNPERFTGISRSTR